MGRSVGRGKVKETKGVNLCKAFLEEGWLLMFHPFAEENRKTATI